MKIHIINSDYLANPTQVISRLFLELAKNAKFTISLEPDDNADLNYFSLYLLYPKNGYKLTKTAALFSHLETNNPSKAKEWNRVAQAVDLRLTWSKLYYDQLVKYGQTAIVIPPLDTEKFKIV